MLYSVLDVDNQIFMRLDDGTKEQPVLMTKHFDQALNALYDIQDKCKGNFQIAKLSGMGSIGWNREF